MSDQPTDGPKPLNSLLSTHLQQLSDEPRVSEAESALPAILPQTQGSVPGSLWRCPLPPATPREIIACLSMLDAVMPSQNATTTTTSLKFQVFCIDLGEFPADVIQAACQAWRRNPANTFFPTPGQLRDVCEDEMRLLKYNSGYREPPAKAAPAWPPKPHPGPMTPEELRAKDLVERAHRGPKHDPEADKALLAKLHGHMQNLPADVIDILSRKKRSAG